MPELSAELLARRQTAVPGCAGNADELVNEAALACCVLRLVLILPVSLGLCWLFPKQQIANRELTVLEIQIDDILAVWRAWLLGLLVMYDVWERRRSLARASVSCSTTTTRSLLRMFARTR